jgi:hypothetical protein
MAKHSSRRPRTAAVRRSLSAVAIAGTAARRAWEAANPQWSNVTDYGFTR